MHPRLLLAASFTVICATTFCISAQRDNRNMESGVTTVLLNDKADSLHVETTLKKNAPKAPNDNGLPRFAIVGKDRLFYLGIGGQFLGEGVFTWGDNMPSTVSFTPSSLTPATPGNGSTTQFAWQTSSIYMNFVAMPGTGNQIGLFFKANFNGDNNAFHCQHFYAKYRGLTVGRTASLFEDGDAQPMTIDDEGPNGFPSLTVFTAYWEQKFTGHLSGAIGIDAPTASITPGTTATQVNQRIPAIPLYLQYAWHGGDSHVRLSGIFRPIQYRDLVDEANKTEAGYGIQLSGISAIAGGLGASLSGAYGRGIGTYLQDDNGLGLDAVATAVPGKISTVRSLGLTAGLNYSFSSRVSANLVYSHLANFMPGDATISDDVYRYGDYMAANVIWNINKFMSAGIEYDYGRRVDLDGHSLHANRLQCQMALTF